MKFQETKLKGSYLINHDNHNEKRGFFERIFCQKTFQTFLKEKNIRQINHSFTKKKGTVRGLHFQATAQTTKMSNSINSKLAVEQMQMQM